LKRTRGNATQVNAREQDLGKRKDMADSRALRIHGCMHP
jgi:hypothetical protein